ncbi:hypothetical protein [Burkholderia gladioli]|uniref:hypothetical protein n=1 Tax=Burkholderia gladioli TaxID=28095 RepID=UPI0016412ABF|nr:hypothetical protein [Burkholderia gladioli]
MLTKHYGEGVPPVVEVMAVVDDFGRLWTLVPDVDYFGRFDCATAMAAIAFSDSDEVH